MRYQVKDFATLQLELIDAKVNMAATYTIAQVVDQIRALKDDVNGLRNELKEEIQGVRTEMQKRFAVVETKLGIVGKRQNKVFDRWLDYVFKAGWLIALSVISYAFLKLHITIT